MAYSNSYLNSVAAIHASRNRTNINIIRKAFNAIEMLGISNFTMETPLSTIDGYDAGDLATNLSNHSGFTVTEGQIPATPTVQDIVNILKQVQVELDVDAVLVTAYEVIVTIKEAIGDVTATTKPVDDTLTVLDLLGATAFTALDVEEALELEYAVTFEVDVVADTTTVAELVDLINTKQSA